MIIRHNLSALNSLNRLNQNNKATSNTLEKLSSGYRINKGADDAAGLAISEKMRAQIRGLEKAQQNIQDGISLIQTAEGGLASIHNPNLVRLRELAIQAANDTLTDADRQLIQKEVEQIKQGIDEIANNTEFNTIKLLNRETGTKTITETTSITTPGYYETTPSVVDLSKATSITIFEATNSGNKATFTISELVSGVNWEEPFKKHNERYVFSVDLVNNTFTTTALRQYSAPYNNITGVRVDGLAGYEDSTVWASEVVSFVGTPHSSSAYALDKILGSNLSDQPVFDVNNTTDTSITVIFHSKKYIPGSTTTVTNTKVINVSDDTLLIHTGANEGQNLEIELADARTKALGIDQLDYSTRLGAEAAIAKIDAAIEKVSAQRGKFGAYQNRLEYTYNNSTNYSMNLTAAESRIRDADIAKETMHFVKSQILTQGAQTMLTHAQNQPTQVLALLQ